MKMRPEADKEEPNLQKDRIESPLPMRNMSNADTVRPPNTFPPTDSVEPTRVNDRTLNEEPLLYKPNALTRLPPIRAKLLTEQAEPENEEWRTVNWEEIRMKLLTEREDPVIII